MALAGKDRSIIPLILYTDHVLSHYLQCLYPGQMTRNGFLYTEFSAEWRTKGRSSTHEPDSDAYALDMFHVPDAFKRDLPLLHQSRAV